MKTKHSWRSAAGCGLTSCLAALALAAVDVNAQDEPAGVVTVSPQGYSVEAAQTNVVQVLVEVGHHAGFSVEAPDNFNSPLTLNAQDIPLDQLLRRVLRNENYIIVYRGGVQKAAISGDQIDKIFLLSPAPGQGGGPAAAPVVSPLLGPGGQHPGQQARNAPPPPPLSGTPEDMAARSALARARAEARRNGIDIPPPPPPPGMPVAQGGRPAMPAAMPGAARMAQPAEEVAPMEPPVHGGGEIQPGDVPPNDGSENEEE